MCLQLGICPDCARGAYSAPPDAWVDSRGHFAAQQSEGKGKEENTGGMKGREI